MLRSPVRAVSLLLSNSIDVTAGDSLLELAQSGGQDDVLRGTVRLLESAIKKLCSGATEFVTTGLDEEQWDGHEVCKLEHVETGDGEVCASSHSLSNSAGSELTSAAENCGRWVGGIQEVSDRLGCRVGVHEADKRGRL